MTTLVIADIHNKVGWIEQFIIWIRTQIQIDEIVFLGDYFDDFGDGIFEAGGTAYWLKESLKHPDRVHLIGNHDMPYMLSRAVNHQWCPGFDVGKDKRINEIITREEWEKIRPAYFTQGWLLSHAGFSAPIFAHPINETDPKELITRAEKAFGLVKGGLFCPEFAQGYRMATEHHGGITWNDWDNEFQPIHGINQIVGHTPGGYIRSKHSGSNRNYCVDCHSNLVVIIEDGNVGVTKTNIK